MISKRATVVLLVIASALGLYAGRFLLVSRHSAAAGHPAGDEQAHEDTAAAASRAMTFTQRKATAK